jgi:8-oxo-dGTP diphosphatase
MLGKRVKVTVDRPLGTYHPEHKDLYYPINYGYINEIIAPDGEEQDAYILGVDKPVQEFEGIVIAIIHRNNDVEEKWVVAPEGSIFTKEEIESAVHFQEKYFDYEIIMCEVKISESAPDELLKFAVIIARTNGKWVFCKHKERDTYESPGGRREAGESIMETAHRELYEETGAIEYDIKPVCYYSVSIPGVFDGKETFGMLCYADITEFEKELQSEIERIIITEELPDKLTYPLTQRVLLNELEKRNII